VSWVLDECTGAIQQPKVNGPRIDTHRIDGAPRHRMSKTDDDLVKDPVNVPAQVPAVVDWTIRESMDLGDHQTFAVEITDRDAPTLGPNIDRGETRHLP
jgi:hypothetical protein